MQPIWQPNWPVKALRLAALGALSVTLTGAAAMAADATTSTSSGTIIWDTPGGPKSAPPAASPSAASPSAAPATNAAPDSNGILWNSPAPRTANAAPAAPAPGGTPDKNGIVWNSPGAPGAPPGGPSASSRFTPPAGAGPDHNGVIWDQPRQAANAAPPGAPGGGCREFQTTIIIDGKPQPAHGTVCQQPDGSWRLVHQ